MNINLKNKVVVITGGTRGLGKVLVDYFIKEKCKVAFCARKINNDKIKQNLLGVSCDITNEEEVKHFIQIIINKFRRIDILINNAGIGGRYITKDMSLKEWNNIINVNLTGSFLITKEVIPYMMKKKYGKIINIASRACIEGVKHSACYCASKAGLIAFSKALALELASYNINVNCISPGVFMTKNLNSGLKQGAVLAKMDIKSFIKTNYLDKIPLNRIASPEEIIYLIIFLSSEFSRYITGQNFIIDGGRTRN